MQPGDQAFNTWFAQSKAVDSSNTPLLLWHGSEIGNKIFNPALTTSKIGSMFSANRALDMLYAQRSHPGYLYEAYLSIQNPHCIALDALNRAPIYGNGLGWRNDLQAQGHDGLIVDNNGTSYFIAFDDAQILEVSCQVFP